MKHLLTALLAALLVAAPAEARPRAEALLTSCHPALDPELRTASFEGRMKRVAGAERMQMRFTLQERVAGAWGDVDAPEWNAWTTSDPRVAEYRYTKEVGRLAAPSVYRSVVRFRWLDAKGRVVARRLVISKRCRQPDLRPDLRIAVVGWEDGRYRVHVRNSGRTRAPASQAELTVDGVRHVLDVPAIKARSTRTVSVAAARCSGTLRALADLGDAVDERDEDDNAYETGCPPFR